MKIDRRVVRFVLYPDKEPVGCPLRPFAAHLGGELLGEAESPEDLLELAEGIWRIGPDEDVVIWRGKKAIAVIQGTADSITYLRLLRPTDAADEQPTAPATSTTPRPSLTTQKNSPEFRS